MGKERHKRAVAKVSLIPTFNEDGFIWKVGGYTAVTGGYTSKSKGFKKTSSFLQSMKETRRGQGEYTAQQCISKQAFILGEVQQDVFLMYSYLDHSFSTWNSVTNQFKTVNLKAKGSNFKRQNDEETKRNIGDKVESVIGNDK